MRAGAARLLGTHDFRGLATSAEVRENTVRTVFRCDVSEHDDEVHVTVQGNGFLYHMVRMMVGVLVYAGVGKLTATQVAEMVAGRGDKQDGFTAPACGLYLKEVYY